MKTKILTLVLSFFAVFALVLNAQAQKTGAPVFASVNISEAKIISQDGNVFKLAFDIANNAGVQPQIIYGVTLLKNQVIVNQDVFNDDTLSLNAGEKIHEEIIYTAPAFLNGDYLLTIEARNSEGFIFGMMPIKNVTLNSSKSSILIKDDSCKVYTAHDPSIKYNPDQGISIDQGDVLKMSCDIENGFSMKKNLTPVVITRFHSVFGKEVNEQKLASFSLAANEKVTKEFEIPLAGQPQFYSGVFKLTDENGNVISNEVYLFYLVQGEGGMIQNVVLDKNSYKAGESANVQVWYNVSVKNGTIFTTTNFIDGGKIYITIKDVKGNACSGQFSQEQKIDQTNNYLIPINKDCVGPVAEVAIKDKDGKILLQNSFAVQIKSENPSQVQKISSEKKVVILIIVALVILIVLLGFFMLKIKNKYKRRK